MIIIKTITWLKLSHIDDIPDFYFNFPMQLAESDVINSYNNFFCFLVKVDLGLLYLGFVAERDSSNQSYKL